MCNKSESCKAENTERAQHSAQGGDEVRALQQRQRSRSAANGDAPAPLVNGRSLFYVPQLVQLRLQLRKQGKQVSDQTVVGNLRGGVGEVGNRATLSLRCSALLVRQWSGPASPSPRRQQPPLLDSGTCNDLTTRQAGCTAGPADLIDGCVAVAVDGDNDLRGCGTNAKTCQLMGGLHGSAAEHTERDRRRRARPATLPQRLPCWPTCLPRAGWRR